MMRFGLLTILMVLACCTFLTSRSQESATTIDKITSFPDKFFAKVNSKISGLDKQLTGQTEKYLKRLAKREDKLQRKLNKLDSNATKNLFLSNPGQQYATYIQKLNTDSVYDPKKLTGGYLAYADSLQGVLSFLDKNQQLLSSSNLNSPAFQNSLGQLQQLQAKMQEAEQAKAFIRQRKQQIKQYLMQFAHLPPGVTGMYNNYNKDLYYYNQQLSEYKEALNNPDQLFRKVLGLLNTFPAFQTFMKNNSILATLFPIPGNYGTPLSMEGLQTRDQVSQVLQGQLSGPNAQNAFSQNMGDAQSQLGQLKDKLTSYGQGGGDVDIPDFKPNQQKTKTFLKRLEYGTSIQTQHSNYFFPTTTDIGLTIGYRLNDKSTLGLGASYKMGWGSDISHINISSQGAGLRSFIDLKMKGSIYMSGGLEYNYQQPFYSIMQVNNLASWQQSGLIGLSKIISMNTKVFKKTKVQLLWDFLSYQQIPKGQPFKFRVGYNF